MIKPLKWNEDATDTTHANAIHTKVSELIDAVNDLEAVVHEGPDDFMSDLDDDEDESTCACDDDDDRAGKETEPFVERLHHLSTSQLEHLLEEAEWILEGRYRQGQEYVCPECQAKAEAAGDDGYCEQCNNCHDLPDDDDEDVTEDVQKVVDDLRGKNEPRGSRKLPSSETYFVTKDDGLLFDLVKVCVNNPELRFWQALRNLSGYNFIFGSTAKDADDYSQLEARPFR